MKSKLELSEDFSQLPSHERKNKSNENDPKYMNAIRPYIKERKNSKRQIQNAIANQTKHLPNNSQINSRSKSKKHQRNDTHRIGQQTNGSQNSLKQKKLSDIYKELSDLKTQYFALKQSYNIIIKEKKQNQSRCSCRDDHADKLRAENQRIKKQNQNLKNNLEHMTMENQRVKKQCLKLIQAEKFKNRKLQQTIQEKQLMTAYLRSQLASCQGSVVSTSSNDPFFFQSTAPIFHDNSKKPGTYCNSAVQSSILTPDNIQQEDHRVKISKAKICGPKNHRLRSQQDSLSFSRDKSKEFESVNSLLSVSNGDQTVLTFTKKDVIILEQSLDMYEQHILPKQIVDDQGRGQCLTFQNRPQQIQRIQHPPLRQITKRLNNQIANNELNLSQIDSKIFKNQPSSLLKCSEDEHKKKESKGKKKNSSKKNFKEKQSLKKHMRN